MAGLGGLSGAELVSCLARLRGLAELVGQRKELLSQLVGLGKLTQLVSHLAQLVNLTRLVGLVGLDGLKQQMLRVSRLVLAHGDPC